MPGLSGSQQAYTLAVADVARADATRAAYFVRNVIPVWIHGAARTGVMLESIRIDLNTGRDPHRCTFSLKGGNGFVPEAGHAVVIGHGTTAQPVFSGLLRQVTRVVARHEERRPVYACEAAGHVFQLGQTAFVPAGFYGRSLSVSSLVRGLLAATSPSATGLGFSAGYIDRTLPFVDEFATGVSETVPDALDRLFGNLDATWYVDHHKGIRAFGAQDVGPGPIPTTITGATSIVWNIEHTRTDLGQAFSGVRVIGRGVSYAVDIDPALHDYAVVSSGSPVANKVSNIGTSSTTGLDQNNNNIDLIVAGRYVDRDASFTFLPESQVFGVPGSRSTLLAMSIGCNTMIVVGPSFPTSLLLQDNRWYNIGGQYIYPTSLIGVFSTAGSSIAAAYAVPSLGYSGAVVSDISSLSDIGNVWNMRVPASIAEPVLKAGTPVHVMVTLVSSTAVNQIGSMSGGSGLVWQTVDDGRLSPEGAYRVGSATLDRGVPSAWESLVFDTRHPAYDLGRPIYVSMSSPAESASSSIAGTFVTQDVSLSGFDRLSRARGPIRRITAGVARNPTLNRAIKEIT